MSAFMRRAVFAAISVVVVLVTLGYGLAAGYLLGRSSTSSDVHMATVGEAWWVLHQWYVEPDSVDSAALAQAAVQAMVDTLDDQHSAYLTAEEYRRAMNNISGSYSGIGVTAAVMGGAMTVLSVTPGSPAEKAGLQAGDIVLEIDSVSTVGMSIDEIVAMVQGPVGTPVTLLIGRDGQELAFTIIRANIQLNTVTFEMLGDVAHIVISSFSSSTNSELVPVLEQIQRDGAAGIIIDLRGNPGGPAASLVAVASHFVSGTLLTMRYNDGSWDEIKTVSTSVTTDLPVVVLVDEYSASASEAFSGAMQDYGRAVIAGEVTFGKGSVNAFYELADGSAIYLTIARWYTPNGHLIEGEGIIPDIMLDASTDWLAWAVEYLTADNT
ncbi:MAG: S41 family peptidase [Dehalococcoidia bacterium]|nr:S41 family peptidase [Dehalococcoidia bacterium]